MPSTRLPCLLLPAPPSPPFPSPRKPPGEACRLRHSTLTLPCCVSAWPLRHGGPSSHRSELERALSAINRAPKPSPFVYNSVIRALNRAGLPDRALSVFIRMLLESSLLDRFTFSYALKSCAQLEALEVGKQIQGMVVKARIASAEVKDDEGVLVVNALIHMYSRCGRTDCAMEIFDQMPRRNLVSWNCMIDGLAKAGDVVSARTLFDEMPDRNIVSWNSMIGGYVGNSSPEDALRLFLLLQKAGVCPDESTMVSVVSAISDLGLLGLGKKAHGCAIRRGLSTGGALGVSLITMYARCGSVVSAHRAFLSIHGKNVAHWTAIVAGFADHGLAEDSVHLFAQMLASGVKPNHITFTDVLSACSHGGLLEEGLKVFNLTRHYGVEPHIQHYGCLVDLLSRAGLVEEALGLTGYLPGAAGPAIWGSLLAACRDRGSLDIAEIVASKMMELEPDYGGGYVLLSNIYARFGKWDDFSRTRKMMEERGVKRAPGFSWIEVDGEIHKFVIGDKFHPRHREMYGILAALECHLGATRLFDN